MTDEERMERASRIRQMREGPTDDRDEQGDETDAEGSAADEEATSEASGDADDEPSGASSGGETQAEAEAAADEATPEEVADAGESDESDAEETDEAADDGEPAFGLVDPEEVEATEEQAPDAEDAAPAGAKVGVDADVESTAETVARVLEFSLGDEEYCLDIDYIEEIVKRDTVTRVPNTPDYVAGVVDLRGQITTILNPKDLIGVDGEGSESLIVVFDAEAFEEQGNLGWLVDDVRQVTPIVDDEINDPPIDEEHINGVVDREDEDFVIWTDPEVALATEA